MNSYDKKLIDKFNKENDNRLKRKLTIAGIISIIGISSIINERFFDHTLYISPLAKVLSDFKNPNESLSIGAKIQLEGMQRDLDINNINANAYYYDYVTFENEKNISLDEYNKLSKSDRDSVYKEVVPYGIKVTNNILDGIKIREVSAKMVNDNNNISYVVPAGYQLELLNNYFMVDSDKNSDVYVIDYDKDNIDDIYLTNNYYYTNNKNDYTKYDYDGNVVGIYSDIEKGPKRILNK